MGERKKNSGRMEGWKENMIYNGFNQSSNTPILQYSVCTHLGTGRYPGLL